MVPVAVTIIVMTGGLITNAKLPTSTSCCRTTTPFSWVQEIRKQRIKGTVANRSEYRYPCSMHQTHKRRLNRIQFFLFSEKKRTTYAVFIALLWVGVLHCVFVLYTRHENGSRKRARCSLHAMRKASRITSGKTRTFISSKVLAKCKNGTKIAFVSRPAWRAMELHKFFQEPCSQNHLSGT